MNGLSLSVGLANVALGTVYTSYGLMTIVDLKRGWRTNGFSHFGAAWIAMAFTCGPHHLDHGAHLLLAGRDGTALDLAVILVGIPFGLSWFLLRVEALFGGRGDRMIAGAPLWVEAAPIAMASYVAIVMAAALAAGDRVGALDDRVVPNLLLVALYSLIAAVLLRTQIRNRPVQDGWSVSGLSLAAVFFTCALMHGVYALYATTGQYDIDGHGLAVDTVSVPAAVYFLWVVLALHRGSLRDWNAVGVRA